MKKVINVSTEKIKCTAEKCRCHSGEGRNRDMDAAASALKPDFVISAEMDFLKNHYANAGRGVCTRATAVDDMVARVRDQVREFIGAKSSDQIIFTSGTTDGMNRVARILCDSMFFVGRPTIWASDLDHHSARMPFEELQHAHGFNFMVCPLDENFDLDVDKLGMPTDESMRARRTAIPDVFIITAMSNVLGRAQDVKKIIARARAKNPDIITIIDAAQYVAHAPINVSDWGCDFLCFSGHKIGADTGIGIMYIQSPGRWSADKFGGGMVSRITGSLATNDSHWSLEPAPAKFEAGTLPLTQIAGLGALLESAESREQRAESREQRAELVRFLHSELSKIPRVKLLTCSDAAMVSFVVDGMHALDFGALAGAHGICLRVGNMCASWIHRRLGIDASIRLSPGPWNTMEQAEQVVEIVKKILKE
ncbi:MAG: aminotransferase class V-fold PLP-dependent enzyme [Rickettsiales bacterium]|nr:aminotransferase class V-fold PLP-dependent enzyme [Rickettsiales bacterium]